MSLLNPSQRALAKRVSDSTNKIHNAFSVPHTLFNATHLAACIYEGMDKSGDSAMRKKIAASSLAFSNSLTQMFLFFKQMGFIKLVQAVFVDVVYNVTNVLIDIKDLYEINSTDSNSVKFLKIVRSICSIASAAITLGALMFTAVHTETIAIATLALSAVWITTKIAVKLLQEMHDSPLYSIH